jgi:outer membrane lipoprotein LolB
MIANRWLRSLVSCLIPICVAGCATLPAPLPERSYSGRFSATATQGGQRENVSGRFVLQVSGPIQTLDLATPLGSTMARIEIGPDGARATGAQLQETRGPDAEALAEQLLGWRLPVSGLADWLAGRAAPGRPARVEHADGRIAGIEQDDWIIVIEETDAQTLRPRRLLLRRAAAAQAPAVDLRLIVDDSAN